MCHWIYRSFDDGVKVGFGHVARCDYAGLVGDENVLDAAWETRVCINSYWLSRSQRGLQ